jgi:hypothetical protein
MMNVPVRFLGEYAHIVIDIVFYPQDVNDVLEYDGSIARSIESQLACCLAAEYPEIIGAAIGD